MAAAAAVDTPGYFVGAPSHYQKPQPLPPPVPAQAVDEQNAMNTQVQVTTLGLCKGGENLLQSTTTLLTLRFNRAKNKAFLQDGLDASPAEVEMRTKPRTSLLGAQ